MKKLLFIALMLIGATAQAQTATKNAQGHYSISKDSVQAKPPTDTGQTFQDSKGKIYPIFKTEKGKFYVIRTSAKTGKQYKQYLTIN